MGAIVGSADDALAYCRTTTIPVPATQSPSACWTKGAPLYFAGACASYYLQKDGSKQISVEQAKPIVKRAFDKWQAPTCAGGGTPSIKLSYGGEVACGTVHYNTNAANQNVIVFRDDAWPHADSTNTLALTTVTFNPDTGEIYDADIEVNTAGHTLSIAEVVGPAGYDFDSIITHEAGHFLGLAHSDQVQATMYPQYTKGSTRMRTLLADDIEGICAIYKPSGARAVATSVSPTGEVPQGACDPTPRHGFSSECQAEGSAGGGSGGCAVVPVASAESRPSVVLGAMGLLGLMLHRLRARSARRRKA